MISDQHLLDREIIDHLISTELSMLLVILFLMVEFTKVFKNRQNHGKSWLIFKSSMGPIKPDINSPNPYNANST